MELIEKYDLKTRALHWISAVIIIWATITGTYISILDTSKETIEVISFINVSSTTILIPIFLARIINRIKTDKTSKTTNKTAELVHDMMYIIISVVLISGILMMDRDINIFNLVTVPRIIMDKETNEMCHTIHTIFSRILGSLILIHLLAVAKHEYTGNRILGKMI